MGARPCRQRQNRPQILSGRPTGVTASNEVLKPIETLSGIGHLFRAGEERQGRLRGGVAHAPREQFLQHAVGADLIELVQRNQGLRVKRFRNAGALEQRRERSPVIQTDFKTLEAKPAKDVAGRREEFGLDDRRRRTDRVDIALVELAKAAPRGPVRPPDRLNLIALEKPWQLVLILRDDARQRNRQVVAQRQVRLAARLVLAALQDLENELVAFFAVLAEQRLDVLEGWRLERLEPIALVDLADDADDILPPADLLGQKIPCTAGRLSRHQLWLEGGWARTLHRATGEAFS